MKPCTGRAQCLARLQVLVLGSSSREAPEAPGQGNLGLVTMTTSFPSYLRDWSRGSQSSTVVMFMCREARLGMHLLWKLEGQ
jgi:hypothetical protein